MRTLPSVELAYAAGFFDGEGCIAISMQSRQNGRVYHQLSVTVAQKVVDPLVWLQQRFGGCLKPYTNNKTGRRYHRWQVMSAQAAAFLRAIKPYALVKAEEIEVAERFRATVNDVSGRDSKSRFPALTSELVETRNALAVELIKIRERKYERCRRPHAI